MSLTKRLAEFTANIKYEELTVDTVRSAKRAILDWLGVAVRGSRSRQAKIIGQNILPDGWREATVFGDGPSRLARATNAAFFNGAASHSLDFDDLHNRSIIHLGTVVVPPAIAIAEKEHCNGRKLIEAVVSGYEGGARIGESVMPESYFFWHTTGTVGTMAAAIASARVLGLGIEETIHAIGSSGSQAAGLWEFVHEGAMSKPLHSGKACYVGVLTAYLSYSGFTGATDIIGGEKGFCRAMLKEPHWEKITDGLGDGYKIDENSFKPYPCCKHSHAAIYASISLRDEYGFASTEVDRIEILVNKVTDDLINNAKPTTSYGCKFSIQYCVASAIAYGKVDLDNFDLRSMDKEEVWRMMGRTVVRIDEKIQAIYDEDHAKLASKVIVFLRNGERLEKTVEYPKGDPDNPMTWDELAQKFRSLVVPVYGEEKAAKLIAFIDKLDECDDVAFELEHILAGRNFSNA